MKIIFNVIKIVHFDEIPYLTGNKSINKCLNLSHSYTLTSRRKTE